MKKFFTILILAIVVFSMNSCFLFKPVQKQCPAYSIDKDDSHNYNDEHDLANQEK